MDLERKTASRVPEVTVIFWVIKVLTTGMGEATSDFFLHKHGTPNVVRLITVVFFAGVALAVALALQFAARRYVPWRYWLAVVMVSVFGTMAADGVHYELHVPYLASTVFFAAVLAVVFVAWNASEKTLSIHSIRTARRETFYWAVVMATFALGTAAGDMTAITLHLGYFASGVLFTVLIAVPLVGWWRFNLNPVFAFWFAYIVTRPLGASFADWMSVPTSRGGLGLGFGEVSAALSVVIAGFVLYLSVTNRRTATRGSIVRRA